MRAPCFCIQIRPLFGISRHETVLSGWFLPESHWNRPLEALTWELRKLSIEPKQNDIESILAHLEFDLNKTINAFRNETAKDILHEWKLLTRRKQVQVYFRKSAPKQLLNVRESTEKDFNYITASQQTSRKELRSNMHGRKRLYSEIYDSNTESCNTAKYDCIWRNTERTRAYTDSVLVDLERISFYPRNNNHHLWLFLIELYWWAKTRSICSFLLGEWVQQFFTIYLKVFENRLLCQILFLCLYSRILNGWSERAVKKRWTIHLVWKASLIRKSQLICILKTIVIAG